MKQKDTLARLLATENLNVVHANTSTAAFNVKDRTLIMPYWSAKDEFMVDYLTAHEVGHALFTPAEGWHEEVHPRGPVFKDFLNVVEDVRIERLIREKYLGLIPIFRKAHKHVFTNGFFKTTDLKEIEKMLLVDRINIFFKGGYALGMRFSGEELKIVRELEQVKTWEQVVDIANRLYEMAKIEKQNEKNSESDSNSETPEEESEPSEIPEQQGRENDPDWDDDEDGEESDSRSETTYEKESDSHSETTDEKESDSRSETTDEEESDDLPDGPETVGELDKRIQDEFTDTCRGKIIELTLPKNFKMMTYKETLSNRSFREWAKKKEKSTKKLLREQKSSVDHMVKEFMLKKRAEEYNRTKISKSGVIDTVKMNNYKLTDDIFRQFEVVEDGKNHGFIIYVDWSGSISSMQKPMLAQLAQLVWFCKAVDVPCEVFAFCSTRKFNRPVELERVGGQIEVSNLTLVQLFSSKMNKLELSTMLSGLIACSQAKWGSFPDDLDYLLLGSTPLNSAIACGPQVFRLFQNKYNVDIVNTVILTDGASDNATYFDSYQASFVSLRDDIDPDNMIYIKDPVSGKTHKLDSSLSEFSGLGFLPWQRRYAESSFLIDAYKKFTGSRVIGIYIAANHRGSLNMLFRKLKEEEKRQFYSRHFVRAKGNVGYDSVLVINPKLLKSVRSDTVKKSLEEDLSVDSFQNAVRSKNVNRPLLNEIVEVMA